ncbi:Mitochondrial-processing peptidase subunit alpha, partial [Stegodyphus mimosarum]
MAVSLSCSVCLNSSLKQFLTRAVSKGSIVPVCRLSQNVDNAVWRTSLSEPLPSAPKPIYATSENLNSETKVETLSNGLRVASQNKFGQSCTVGVVIDSGSRYEVAYPSGISHFLEKLAFNSTAEFEDKNAILQELEKHGGICDCQGNRDTLIYAASANSKSLDPVIKLLSEAVLRPKLSAKEIDSARQTIQFELEDLEMRQDQELLLTEMVHAAAYEKNTLGLPKLCPPENVFHIDRTVLYTYLKYHFIPSRMVIAGVGIEHDALVESCQRHFVENPPIWETESLASEKEIPVDNSLAQYTGGMVKLEKDLSNVNLGPTPMPELAHFVLGLESCSHQSPDFIPFCVLNTMMGGGGSFSAGGPGKGMYTRLYTNVLNRHHWMYSATAMNHAYNDTGLFCISASAHPSKLKDLVDVIVSEFKNMTGQISHSELERAKTQLQSVLLMNLESRPVVFEDIGRQVLATGTRKEPEFFIEGIAKVTSDVIHNIATRMLKNKASVAALGDLKYLPSLKEIDASLVSKEKLRAQRFSLFS